MNWRMWLTLLCLISLAAGGWYAHQFLQDHALAKWVGTEWRITAESWNVLVALWPAVLFLALIISLIFTLILAIIYEKAHSIDENEEIQRCKEDAVHTVAHYKTIAKNAVAARDLAQSEEQTAYSFARNELDGEWEKLKEVQARLQAAEKDIQMRNQQTNRAMNETEFLITQANEERDLAIADQQRLIRKSTHASAAFQRQKRKAQKLVNKLEGPQPSG